MSQVPALSIKNLSKMYQIYDRPQDRLKQSLSFGRKKFYREFWALRNLTLDIDCGQTVGIIGHNGSGKSTLLQIVAGTLTPTGGQAQVNGRVAALLELGSGFNPDLTGRENVYMNGLIMGMSREDMTEKLPSIERFAEIGEFMDQPVKVYSSGMFVRLAFACAVNVDPDVLIIDEALSVGDMHFQLKCIEKMKAFKRKGKTILFVSHDTYAVKNFCDQAIWMRDGQIYLRGDANTVTHEYEEFMKGSVTEEVTEAPVVIRKDVLTIERVRFFGKEPDPRKDFSFQESVTVVVDYTVHAPMDGIVGGIAIYGKDNTYVCGLNTKLDQCPLPSKPGRYQLRLSYDEMHLLPGTYFVDVGFFESAALITLDYKSRYDYFRVNSDGLYFAEGVTFLKHQWSCEGE